MKLQSMIKQFEKFVHETGQVSLTKDDAWVLLSEIKFLQLENERLENGMDAIREAIKTYDYLCKHEEDNIEPLTLKPGDKIRRISDGEIFTYVEEDDMESGEYVYVEEMVLTVCLADFKKVKQK